LLWSFGAIFCTKFGVIFITQGYDVFVPTLL
jgi:hypothetical protein